MRDNPGAVDHLLETHYADPALPPTMTDPEGEGPRVGSVDDVDARLVDGNVEVEWDEIEGARFYALYRLPADAVRALEDGDDDAYCAALDTANLVGMTGEPTLTDTEPLEEGAGYVVTALDDFRAEGPVGEIVDVRG
ncbi:hypothetical protein [Nocardiopsis alba]